MCYQIFCKKENEEKALLLPVMASFFYYVFFINSRFMIDSSVPLNVNSL